MTLVDYCDREGLAHWPIYAHLHRHGLCSSNCTRLEDIATTATKKNITASQSFSTQP